MRVPYTTTNEARDTMIIKAAARIAKQEPPQALTLEAAQKLLPPGFDLDIDEWNGILSNFAPDPEPVEYDGDPAELKHAADGGVLAHQPGASKPLENFAPPHANGAAPKEAPRLDFNASVARLKELQRQLAEHRNEVMALSRLAQEKKGVLARAVSAWQVGALEGDPEKRRMDEVRDHLRGVTEARAKRVESLPPELRSKYGSAADYARKQRAVPPGVDPQTLRKGSGRGAFPSSARVLPGVGVK